MSAVEVAEVRVRAAKATRPHSMHPAHMVLRLLQKPRKGHLRRNGQWAVGWD